MHARHFTAQLAFELEEIKNDFRSFRFYRMLAEMVVGLIVCSIAVNGIIIPHHYFSGGTAGLSLMVYYLAGWPSLGTIYLIINIPLFIIGWREYALRYVLISVLGVLFFSVTVDLTRGIVLPISDPLIAAVMAGVMMGSGVGIYLRDGGSGGGMDILAKFIRKRIGIPMGTSMNLVNAINLMGAFLIYDLTTAFYSGIYMGVLAFLLDKVTVGLAQHRAVFIITSFPEAVSERIQQELGRGVTFIHTTGGYSHRLMKMVYSVINIYELGRLKQIMFEIDPDSILTVAEASEVIGRRFRTFEDEGFRPPFVWKPSVPAARLAQGREARAETGGK